MLQILHQAGSQDNVWRPLFDGLDFEDMAVITAVESFALLVLALEDFPSRIAILLAPKRPFIIKF